MDFSKKTDKIMTMLAFAYLAIPIAQFLIYWTALYVWIPVLALLIFGIYLATKDLFQAIEKHEVKIRVAKIPFFSVIVTIICWTILSGIGGYSFQGGDHFYRNAIFNDLSNLDWPVIFNYNSDKFFFVYYFIYWLPSAAISKFFGANLGHFSLLAWTCLGIFIAVYHSITACKKLTFIFAIGFIFYAGFDLVPCALRAFSSDCAYSEFNAQFLVPQYYKDNLCYWKNLVWFFYVDYRGITDSLFTVFNQCIPAWIATSIVLRNFSIWTKILAGGMMFCFAPFPFMGIGLLLLFSLIIRFFRGENLRKIFEANPNFPKMQIISSLAASISIGVVFALFFSMNGKGMSFFWFAGLPIKRFLVFYVILVSLQCLISAIFLFRIIWRIPDREFSLIPLAAATLSLLFIPIFQIVEPMNFIMRAAIPAIFIFAVYSGYVLANINRSKTSSLLKKTYIAYFAICAIIPFAQILRSATKTAVYEDFLNEPENTFSVPIRYNVHFCAKNYSEKIFYKFFTPAHLKDRP